MKTYDIGIGWADSVESAFVAELKAAARARKKSFREITLETLTDDLAAVERGDLFFSTYMDRGFLEFFGFTQLGHALESKGARVVNSPAATLRSSSKALLYPKLKKAGLPLPKTVLFDRRTKLPELEKAARMLGKPFVIVSSYGLGDPENRLQLSAQRAEDMRTFMEDNYADTFLAHEYVQPGLLGGRNAWFRPLFAAGEVIPMWWDPLSGYYELFGNTPRERAVAKKMEGYMRTIHEVSGLELFSSEFAQTPSGKLVLIDYANTPVDLNSSDNVPGGLPPKALQAIARNLVG